MKEIDWSSLSFGYMKTDYNVRCWYRNGAWGEIEISSEETLNIHMAATCLHYGQEAFEGLKAYRCPDGKSSANGLHFHPYGTHAPCHPDNGKPSNLRTLPDHSASK